MRRVIASRLAESIGPIPTFYLTVEIEMDNTLELRKQVNASVVELEIADHYPAVMSPGFTIA